MPLLTTIAPFLAEAGATEVAGLPVQLLVALVAAVSAIAGAVISAKAARRKQLDDASSKAQKDHDDTTIRQVRSEDKIDHIELRMQGIEGQLGDLMRFWTEFRIHWETLPDELDSAVDLVVLIGELRSEITKLVERAESLGNSVADLHVRGENSLVEMRKIGDRLGLLEDGGYMSKDDIKKLVDEALEIYSSLHALIEAEEDNP